MARDWASVDHRRAREAKGCQSHNVVSFVIACRLRFLFQFAFLFSSIGCSICLIGSLFKVCDILPFLGYTSLSFLNSTTEIEIFCLLLKILCHIRDIGCTVQRLINLTPNHAETR